MRLARAGHDVVLVEEHEAIGVPVHCTGLLGLEAFDEFDLPRATILGLAGSARFWGAAGESVLVASERIRAAVIDRGHLDEALAADAARAGVRVVRGWRAEGVSVGSAGVRIKSRGGDEIGARVCVLACGATYRFHRQLGLGVPSVFLQSAQLETPFPDASDIEVRFGREVAPARVRLARAVPPGLDLVCANRPHDRDAEPGALPGVRERALLARGRGSRSRCRTRG